MGREYGCVLGDMGRECVWVLCRGEGRGESRTTSSSFRSRTRFGLRGCGGDRCLEELEELASLKEESNLAWVSKGFSSNPYSTSVDGSEGGLWLSPAWATFSKRSVMARRKSREYFWIESGGVGRALRAGVGGVLGDTVAERPGHGS